MLNLLYRTIGFARDSRSRPLHEMNPLRLEPLLLIQGDARKVSHDHVSVSDALKG